MILPHDPRLWPNQPGFAESLSLFILYGYMLLACIGDTYYTSLGLAKGFVEANPINAWLFPKLGQALTAFLEITAVTFTGMFISGKSMPAAFVYFGAVAVLESIMVFRNRKLLGYAKPYFLF